jgi:hypothetical protein
LSGDENREKSPTVATNQRDGDGHVDTGDRHQPAYVGPFERHSSQLGVEEAEFVTGEVQLT